MMIAKLTAENVVLDNDNPPILLQLPNLTLEDDFPPNFLFNYFN